MASMTDVDLRHAPHELGLAPAPGPDTAAGTRIAAAGEADQILVRWHHLNDDQREQVLDYLAQRIPDAITAALDFEERTRPDGD